MYSEHAEAWEGVGCSWQFAQAASCSRGAGSLQTGVRRESPRLNQAGPLERWPACEELCISGVLSTRSKDDVSNHRVSAMDTRHEHLHDSLLDSAAKATDNSYVQKVAEAAAAVEAARQEAKQLAAVLEAAVDSSVQGVEAAEAAGQVGEVDREEPQQLGASHISSPAPDADHTRLRRQLRDSVGKGLHHVRQLLDMLKARERVQEQRRARLRERSDGKASARGGVHGERSSEGMCK